MKLRVSAPLAERCCSQPGGSWRFGSSSGSQKVLAGRPSAPSGGARGGAFGAARPFRGAAGAGASGQGRAQRGQYHVPPRWSRASSRERHAPWCSARHVRQRR